MNKPEQFLVIALSVHSDLTQRVYNAGEVVSENDFPDGHAAKLVDGNFLEPYTGKTEDAQSGDPYVVTAADVEHLPGMGLTEGQTIYLPHPDLCLVDADSQATNEEGTASHDGGKVLALISEAREPQPTGGSAVKNAAADFAAGAQQEQPKKRTGSAGKKS